MKRRTHLFQAVTALLLALILFAISGCSDDDKSTTPEPQPPDLPPQASFVMDYGDFIEETGYVIFLDRGSDPASHVNWGQSAFRIAFWDFALSVTLAVPVAAFVESFQHQPVQQPDGSWEWSYSVTVGVQYTCRLVGRTDAGMVEWEMYISKQGAYSDYLWYYGSHNLPATEGAWTVNRDPNQSNPFLSIEWHRDVADSTGDLKYTYVVPVDADSGGYIFFGSDIDSTYDRFYHLYNKAQDNLAEIEWNYEFKNGRVRDEFFYGDTVWHCWDMNLEDSDCD